jgi:acyl-CoA synthetase (AMP-forming)/AMP-acid ligase II/acyl carrier protein
MNLDDDFIFLQSAEIGSDISIWQMLAPLLKGGVVVIIDKMDLLDINKTINILEETKITLVEFVPSYVRVLIKYIKEMDIPPLFNNMKWIMLTGEESSIILINELVCMFPHIKYLNAYGPCEASDDAIQYVIESELPANQARLPIGRPIINMNVVILDEKEQLSPIGVIGEIGLTGIGVGAGYIHDMQKTTISFIDNPFDEMLGNKLYKTGDLGRWLPDGNVEFWGRKDSQVKIRGNRVELGEIEAVIIQESYVEGVYITNHDSKDELIAVIVPMKKESKVQCDIEYMESNLRVVCQRKLPQYMQPDYFIFIDKFPINNSHKIDKKKLMVLIKKEEIKMKVNTSNAYVAPRNQQEKTMVNIWKETLNIDQVGIYDNFFELGGHSLLVVRIINEIKNKFFIEIPISSFFSNACVADLCNYLQSRKEEETEHNIEYDLLDL